MKNALAIVSIALFLVSCKSKQATILSTSTNPTETSSSYEVFWDISEYSPNKKYGIDEKYPVMVGDRKVANQRKYIASLAGPNGEELTFFRRGSCCPYPSENGLSGTALVDVYMVSYEGLKDPIALYISFYDKETLYIPKGFTAR